MQVTVKGQVTIPRKIREKLGIRPGSKVEFIENERGEVVLQLKEMKESRFSQVRGSANTGLSTEEIMHMTRGDH
ncbi:AbrB/MazE/SpoVT family DNA-binding domain-containing protein [Catalinimonas sp. 4WD22]|uniref:AbrB/MazE/SpoVT family DNA-binding domain-containing protein n=1 Tax=Catalinimonas locisalis TaxID=3133978 RepID=UPI003101A406